MDAQMRQIAFLAFAKFRLGRNPGHGCIHSGGGIVMQLFVLPRKPPGSAY